MRRLTPAFFFLFALPSAFAANLDVSASYKMKAVSYKNWDLGQSPGTPINHSYLSNDARLGVEVSKIALQGAGEEATMDVGVRLRALGVSGSTLAVSTPINRAAAAYPNVNLTPFIENAYVRSRGLWGLPMEMNFGRQSFRLGSGLLLDDDGAGLTGATMRGELPWAGLKAEGFIFQDRHLDQASGPNSLTLFGLDLSLPTEGTWQLNQLFERDRADQLVYGCTYAGDPDADGCRVSQAFRSFTSARYQISYGPMFFDGEAALEKGSATPGGPVPAGNHITYNGNAQVVRAKWKQGLYKGDQGIARISVARGSGQYGNGTTDHAFFPSHGHRYDGLDRDGFGQFYAATPYDAYGGNYSTSTISGLPQGASGIIAVGGGYTPPAYRGFAIDLDYYLYQAERVNNGSRTLGMEWDARLRYAVRDQFSLALSAAYFKAGDATNLAHPVARRYAFEATGRF